MQCKCEVGEGGAGENPCEDIPVEINHICLVKAKHGLGIWMLKYMLSAKKREEDQIDDAGSDYISVGQSCEWDIGMMQKPRTPEIDAHTHQTQKHRSPYLTRLPPIEIIAVDTDEGEA